MINIRDLIDHAKCYQTVRELRWPDGISCPIVRHHPSSRTAKMRLNLIANVTSATAAASGSTT